MDGEKVISIRNAQSKIGNPTPARETKTARSDDLAVEAARRNPYGTTGTLFAVALGSVNVACTHMLTPLLFT